MIEDKAFFCPQIMLPSGWAANVAVHVDNAGVITGITANATPDTATKILAGPVMPGMANVHCHAFQRAMAGLSHWAAQDVEDFWSWRETMYAFVQNVDGGQMKAITGYLYMEMLKAGYTAVGEFHYLHRGTLAAPTTPLALSQVIIAAAEQAVMPLTLIPCLYMTRAFGAAELEPHQKRFDLDAAAFANLHGALSTTSRDKPLLQIGSAFHSLRAVPDDVLLEMLTSPEFSHPDRPIHIHIAEQTKEVKDCLAYLKQRPVEWLLNHCDVNERWCLVHATHINDDERRALVESGATVGLCPTTEADLGDGIFPFTQFIAEGGRFGIGSDSNVCVDPAQELRLLDFVHRLLQRKRNVQIATLPDHIGNNLWSQASTSGARALGQPTGSIEVGKRADMIVLNSDHPLMAGRSGPFIADTLIFSGAAPLIRDVVIAGRIVVQNGVHVREDEITGYAREAFAALNSKFLKKFQSLNK